MGKVKQANGKAAKAANPLTAVKNAGIKKSTDSPKAKSKALAKDVASKAVNNKELEKKKKKSKKVVEPESESESESDSDASESDSASEDSESDDASGSSDDDSDASESEEEKPAAKAQTNGKANGKVTKPATNGKAKAAKEESSDDSDSSDDDEEDSDDSDDSEDKGAKVAKPAAATAEKTKAKEEVRPFQYSHYLYTCANVNSSLTKTLMTLTTRRRTPMTQTIPARNPKRPRRNLNNPRSVRLKRRFLHLSRRPRPRPSLLGTNTLHCSSETLAGLSTMTSCTRLSRTVPTSAVLELSPTRPCNALAALDMLTSHLTRAPRPHLRR